MFQKTFHSYCIAISVISTQVFLYSAALGYAVNVYSQDSNSVNVSSFTGDITKIDNHTVTIKSGDVVKEFTIPDNVVIKKNTIQSDINTLKQNDHITVSTNSNNNDIVSVEAYDGNVIDSSKAIILPAVIILVLALVAYYLWEKSHINHIKSLTASRL